MTWDGFIIEMLLWLWLGILFVMISTFGITAIVWIGDWLGLGDDDGSN